MVHLQRGPLKHEEKTVHFGPHRTTHMGGARGMPIFIGASKIWEKILINTHIYTVSYGSQAQYNKVY